MTVHFDTKAIVEVATPARVMKAMERCFAIEADGDVDLPPRIDTPTPTGFFRCMPARLGDVVGVKTMTLVRGVGNRYLFLLSDVATGELLAVFDAAQLTALRTAGVTTLAGSHMLDSAPTSLALIGSGMEAESHLSMMAEIWPLERVTVWSRNVERREAFAARLSMATGVEVSAGRSMEATLRSSDVVVLATKSETPVINGSALNPGSNVLSIGSTRPVLRELDERSMRRTKTLVVDSIDQVLAESGDIQTALENGWLEMSQMVSLADVVAGSRSIPSHDEARDISTFKSVGTALQDLALARMLHLTKSDHTEITDLGELAGLKGND